MTFPDKKQFKKIIKISGLVSAALLVAFLLGYFAVYRPLAIREEKKNFLAAEKALDDLQAKIITSVGTPTNSLKKNTCGKQSAKLEEGRLFCTTRTVLLYENTNPEASTALVSEITQVTGGSPLESSGNKFEHFVSVSQHRGEQRASQNISVGGGLDCTVQYIYPATYSFENPLTSKYPENLQVFLSCSDFAHTAHFPLEK